MSRVIVFGSINLDLITNVSSHPKLGETVSGSDYKMLAGGKGANQAYAASKVENVEVVMVGAVGADVFSSAAVENLKTQNINLENVQIVKSAGTGVALIAVDTNGENTIIVTPGANNFAKASQLKSLSLCAGDILLTQNELMPKELFLAHKMARKADATIIHNAAPAHIINENDMTNIDYLIVNEGEATAIAAGFGLTQSSYEYLAKHIYQISKTNLIVTLGEKGAVYFSGEKQLFKTAKSIDVVDTTGAGDAFCGVFASELLSNNSSEKILAKAVDAGGRACKSFGAQN